MLVNFGKYSSISTVGNLFSLSSQSDNEQLQMIREWTTLSMVTVGHRDIFDINVPPFILIIWYQCPRLVPPTEHRFPYISDKRHIVAYFFNVPFLNDTTLIPSNTPLPSSISSLSSKWAWNSAGGRGCPTWLRTLISSVPVPAPEFWYRPMVTVPLWPY